MRLDENYAREPVGTGRFEIGAWRPQESIAIALAVVGFNLLGDGLRDAMDVRSDG